MVKFIGEEGFYPKWAQGEGRWVLQRNLIITGKSAWFNPPPPPEADIALVWVSPKGGFLGLGKMSAENETSRAESELKQIPFKCYRCGWEGRWNGVIYPSRQIYVNLICPECLSSIYPDLRELNIEVIIRQWDQLGRPPLEMPGAAANIKGMKPIENLADWITSFKPMENELAYVGQQLWPNFACFIRSVQNLADYKRINAETFKNVIKGLVFFGANDGNLYALDAQTGELMWKYKIGESINSSPVVGNKLVYFGAWDKKMHALDIFTGKLKWSYETEDNINSSPAIANGMIYFGSWDKKLYALDAITGKLVWSFRTKGRILCNPKVAGKLIYFGSEDGIWYALDACSGKVEWTFTRELDSEDDEELGYKCVGSYHDIVYFIGSDEKLYALNAVTGNLIWNYYDEKSYEEDFSGGVSSVAVDKSGVVYCSGVLLNADIIALNEKTGEVIGKCDNSQEVELCLPDVGGYLTVENGIIYIASDDAFYAIDGETGRVIWRWKYDNYVHIDKDPFIEDRIICFTREKAIYALDTITGDCRWNYEAKDEISTRPCIHLTAEDQIGRASPPDKRSLFCTNCGVKVSRTANFCRECGYNLKEDIC